MIIGPKTDTIGTLATSRYRKMHDLAATFLNEEFNAADVTPAQLDELLANGWRHFGPQFFRYNLGVHNDEIRRVIPLRIRLSEFKLSKSQHRVMHQNRDLAVRIERVAITAEVQDLFHRHKQRFKQHPPDSIYSFVSADSETEPSTTFQQSVRLDGRLLAAGFIDIGGNSLSAIYTSFEPGEPRRSLGIFTILKEIEYAMSHGKEFYYQGYCYSGRSFYDYKKLFHGTEGFDWNGNWMAVPRGSTE